MHGNPPGPIPAHHERQSQPAARPMRDVTRYLAAAGYLSSTFRETALRELVYNRHRAVAPSHGGLDVVAVLRHCLRARSFLLAREIILTGILVIGFLFFIGATFQWLFFVLPFAVLTTAPFRRLTGLQILIAWVFLAMFFTYGSLTILAGALVTGASGGLSGVVRAASVTASGFLLMAMGTLGVAIAYRIAVYQTLARRLHPGALPPDEPPPDEPPPGGRSPDGRTEEQLRWVGAAQHGSLTLYSGASPFLGAGRTARAWSIAVELDRKAGARSASVNRELVEIDPGELHGFVRQRLVQMSRESHRTGIRNLQVRDQVIVAGRHNQLYGRDGRGPGLPPLVDSTSLRPRTTLTAEEILAVIHSPQAGARHYQRLDINSEGDAVHGASGVFIPAEDRGTSVTAFVHLAVEGRMLYTEFIVTALPPVAKPFRAVDELPTESPLLSTVYALKGQYLELFRDIVAAPFRLGRTAMRSFREAMRADDPRIYAAYDYGARISLRELAAAPAPDTFIQELDTLKYTKLVEERLTAAVLDFLEIKGVDTTAYRQQATAVSVSSTQVFNGPVNNSQIGGGQSYFQQNNAPQRGQESS